MIDFKSIPEDQISAVHALEGRTISTGWTITKKVNSKPGSTGGNFSVYYLAEKDGQEGFLKALNILSFIRDDNPDLLQATTESLNTFNFERDLMQKCADTNCSKVSRLLDAGQENISGFLIANVYYLIFEKADDDVRNYLNFSQSVDVAWKLRSLHNISVGLKQLHTIGIGHQDVKPSNVFVFDKIASKLGDLGRSLSKEFSGPHSKMKFSGDPRYAPPEVYYGYFLSDWDDRVKSIDCYLLGSMASFYFTGQNMMALVAQHINSNINILSMPFESSLPYWIEAFDKAMIDIENSVSTFEKRKELVALIRMLCYPDPKIRGHKKNIIEGQNNYRLERIVTAFNVLATKAEYSIIN